jgi:enoyl-CoA hydratase/carnithine racemase
MSGGTVTSTVEKGGVGLLVVDHAPVNALSRPVRRGLVRSLDAFASDLGVRVVILTGRGSRAFSAGQDFAELAASGGRLTAQLLLEFEEVCEALSAVPVPTIAAVNGPAVGGGLDLALSCDLVWASDTATFKTPGLAMGIVAGVPRLAGRVSPGQLAQLVYTGVGHDAAAAHRLGIVDDVIPAGALLQECLERARLIADRPRDLLVAAKRVLRAASAPERTQLVEAQMQASFGQLSPGRKADDQS